MNSPTATKAKLPRNQAELLTYKMEVQAATYEAAARHISFALRTGFSVEDAVAQLQHRAAERAELAADPERATAEGWTS
jgi:hypothetical protein